jgi:hypothetical protein
LNISNNYEKPEKEKLIYIYSLKKELSSVKIQQIIKKTLKIIVFIDHKKSFKQTN